MGNETDETMDLTETGDESESAASSSETNEDASSKSITQPRKGEVVADENKRFLAEIVALRAMERISDAIAKSIVAEVREGKILIVNEMDFAGDEILYLDIRYKLNTLLDLSKKANEECQKFIPHKEERAIKGLGKEAVVTQFAPPATLAAIPALIAGIPKVPVFLGAIGDIVGLFRSDYELKGQTLTVPEDIYIQAIVADRLHRAKLEAYLIDFHSLKESILTRDLNYLIQQKFEMLACAEAIKNTVIDAKSGQTTALETYVAKLREKLADALLKADKNVIDILEKKIEDKIKTLDNYQRDRMPDTLINGLESYLASLRNKMAEELLKNDPKKSIEELEFKIKEINEKLKDKTLKEDEVQSLNDQRKLYQTKMVDLVVNCNYNTKEILKVEIDCIEKELEVLHKDRRPTTQINAIEAHIASLNTKLVDSLATNDEEIIDCLNREIDKWSNEIKKIRESMREAQEIVGKCTKVNDAIDVFITSITNVPIGRNYSPYVIACAREYFAGDQFKYILKLKLITSGADFIIEKPAFWSNDVRTSYLGGGIVSFILAEKNGRIAASGTISRLSALDHRIGDKPKEINWNIRPKYKKSEILSTGEEIQ
ncbi:MAG TPA: hypothetical protein PK105_08590 [Rectinema sp.]|nr:hypothetical protein [Rectinema sp.]HQE69402.1 hypothetical protein [Rectinema sp.]